MRKSAHGRELGVFVCRGSWVREGMDSEGKTPGPENERVLRVYKTYFCGVEPWGA